MGDKVYRPDPPTFRLPLADPQGHDFHKAMDGAQLHKESDRPDSDEFCRFLEADELNYLSNRAEEAQMEFNFNLAVSIASVVVGLRQPVAGVFLGFSAETVANIIFDSKESSDLDRLKPSTSRCPFIDRDQQNYIIDRKDFIRKKLIFDYAAAAIGVGGIVFSIPTEGTSFAATGIAFGAEAVVNQFLEVAELEKLDKLGEKIKSGRFATPNPPASPNPHVQADRNIREVKAASDLLSGLFLAFEYL